MGLAGISPLETSQPLLDVLLVTLPCPGAAPELPSHPNLGFRAAARGWEAAQDSELLQGLPAAAPRAAFGKVFLCHSVKSQHQKEVCV